MDKPYRWKGRVYFADTDAASVVHHSKYILWLEASRIDFLTDIGCSYFDFQQQKIGFVPVNININYISPLRFGDDFVASLYLERLDKASFVVATDFYHIDGRKICDSKVKLAVIDETTWKPCKVPSLLIEKVRAQE